MRYQKVIIYLIFLFTFYGLKCTKQNIVDSQLSVLVEGNWQGQINGRSLFLTLIEGQFENSPTVTGSAHLNGDSAINSFLVMGGTHNGKDSVWFALYEPNTYGKETYQFKARIFADSLCGTYREFDTQNQIVQYGTWYTIRIP